MLKSIVTLCVRHFGAVSALSLLALILGCWGALKSPLDVFPEFVPSAVDVQTEAPGLAPQQVEELVTKHSAIMDKYDPEKKVALVVDEWGVWTDVEPGTNPGFLYQQNSLRDALIAGTTLNIFNNHSDRVRMAALAQTVNVLQSLILTNKEKMVLTPTYHIFDMYKVHQDAKYLPIKLDVPNYEVDGKKIQAVNASASQDSTGKVHISLVNLDMHNAITITTELKDVKWSAIKGQVLTSANITDINTFANPNKLHLVSFTGAKKDGDKLVVTLPAKSVVTLELQPL